MAYYRINNPMFQAFDSAGNPLAGGRAYFYESGSDSNAKTVYKTASGTPHEQPVVLDARGEAAIYGTGDYKIVLKDANDRTIWTMDPVHIQSYSNFGTRLINAPDPETARGPELLSLGTAALCNTGTDAGEVVLLEVGTEEFGAQLPAVDGRQLDLTHVPQNKFPAGLYGYPRGYLYGFKLSNNPGYPDTCIDIAPGSCRDSTNTYNIDLDSPITKDITFLWSPGSGGGGLDDTETPMPGESRSSEKWYYVYVIYNPEENLVDALISDSCDAPTLTGDLAGYTYFRRVGTVMIDKDGDIIPFKQYGDEFYWDIPLVESITNTNGTQQTLTLKWVPSGFPVLAFLSMGFSGDADIVFTAYSADLADLTGDFTLSSSVGLANKDRWQDSSGTLDNYWRIDPVTPSRHVMGKAQSLYGDNVGADKRWNTLFERCVRTNASAQIKLAGLSELRPFRIQVNGWVDRRGFDE